MRRLLLLILLLSFVVFARPTTAQQTPQPTCNAADVIKQAQALKSTGNDQKDLTALLAFRDQISAADVTCNGLTFSGKDASKLIGPLTLNGTYKLTATTPGYIIVSEKLTDPSCDPMSDSDGLTNVGKGEGDTGKETIVTFKGCKMFLELSNVDMPWKLTFEPIN